MRDGLVIKYETQFAREDKATVVGVFVPDDALDTLQAFVFSEPPSHDEWQENSDRLRGKFPWGHDFLRLTKSRLRNLTRDFQTRQAPRPDAERTDVDGFLRRALRDLFHPPSRSPRPGPVPAPSPRPRAFTIARREFGRRQRGTSTGSPEDYATFSIGLSEHTEVDTVVADVTVSLRALADVDARPGFFIPCAVAGPGTTAGDDDGSAGAVTITVELRRDETVDVAARGSVHPQWKTEWQISVARHEE